MAIRSDQVYLCHADNLTTMLRRIPIFLALVLVFAACTTSTEPTTTTTADSGEVTTTGEGTDTTSTTHGEDTTSTSMSSATPTTEPDLSGLEGVSEEVRVQLEELIVAAQEIRGLPFLTPPIINVVTSEEFQALIVESIAEDTTDLPADEALYKMLGLLAEEADLVDQLTALYGEQAAGVYFPDTKEIVVPAKEGALTVVERGTVLHELVHALTDQHFDFGEKGETLVEAEMYDQAMAYQALYEGDASLAMALWAQTLTLEELGEYVAEALEIDQDALNSAPRFLRESLLFPYDTGLAFAQALYVQAEGWDTINDAYVEMIDLPGSTEQVITPDDYSRDLPMEVEIPTVTVPGYELQTTSTWGEQGFRIMLNQGPTAANVATAADGWGGDSYHQWYDGGENAAMLIAFEGDTPGDEGELEEALLTFAMESFPEEHFAWVEQSNGTLYFIAASETAVGEQIRSAVGLG